MLYEFKADWSGEVLAERVTRSKGTYLGLRFPASDIPAVARALYAQTPYRHIPDVAGEPIAVLGAGGPGTSLDLTWSDLRSVSPVHREYLHNMQVAASFSVSVIVDGKLWGLVACHNPEPLRVPLATRMRCQELVAQFVAVLSRIVGGSRRRGWPAWKRRWRQSAKSRHRRPPSPRPFGTDLGDAGRPARCGGGGDRGRRGGGPVPRWR